jgi:hypothetical protein
VVDVVVVMDVAEVEVMTIMVPTVVIIIEQHPPQYLVVLGVLGVLVEVVEVLAIMFPMVVIIIDQHRIQYPMVVMLEVLDVLDVQDVAEIVVIMVPVVVVIIINQHPTRCLMVVLTFTFRLINFFVRFFSL